VIRRKDFEGHKSNCEYRPVECKLCKLDIQFKKVEEHLQNFCTAVKIKCHACEAFVLRTNLDYHHDNTCPDIDLTCPFYCGLTLKRKHLELHLKDNVQAHLQSLRDTYEDRYRAQEAHYSASLKDLSARISDLELRIDRPDTKFIWQLDWTQAVRDGYVESRMFCFQDLNWTMGLYPNGDGVTDSHYASLYLFPSFPHHKVKQLAGTPAPLNNSSIDVQFSFTMKNHIDPKRSMKMTFHECFPAVGGWGTRAFADTNQITRDNGYLTDRNLLVLDLELNLSFGVLV